MVVVKRMKAFAAQTFSGILTCSGPTTGEKMHLGMSNVSLSQNHSKSGFIFSCLYFVRLEIITCWECFGGAPTITVPARWSVGVAKVFLQCPNLFLHTLGFDPPVFGNKSIPHLWTSLGNCLWKYTISKIQYRSELSEQRASDATHVLRMFFFFGCVDNQQDKFFHARLAFVMHHHEFALFCKCGCQKVRNLHIGNVISFSPRKTSLTNRRTNLINI